MKDDSVEPGLAQLREQRARLAVMKPDERADFDIDATHALLLSLVLLAGWGDEVPGATLNRFCASGVDAVGQTAGRIRGGDLGSSAAQSVVLMLIVITLTVMQFRYIEGKVQY